MSTKTVDVHVVFLMILLVTWLFVRVESVQDEVESTILPVLVQIAATANNTNNEQVNEPYSISQIKLTGRHGDDKEEN